MSRVNRRLGVYTQRDHIRGSWIDLNAEGTVLQVNALLGGKFRHILTSSVTFFPPFEPHDGQRLLFRFQQNNTGGHTVTLSSSGWAQRGVIPDPLVDATGGSVTFLEAVYDGAEEVWELMGLPEPLAPRKVGLAVLLGGSVTVADTGVTANSRIFLTPQENGVGNGSVRVASRTPGVEFVISSSSVLDDADVAYLIYEP